MLTIFNGRKLSLDGDSDEIYAQVAIALRNYIHLFNNGKNLNAFSVFMCIALHADKYGWSWPGRKLLMQETGISTQKAITKAVTHLREMQIDGHGVLAVYRTRSADGTLGPLIYRLFPDRGGATLHVPEKFRGVPLHPLDGQREPGVDEPLVVDHPDKKDNQNLEGEAVGVSEHDLDDIMFWLDGTGTRRADATDLCHVCGNAVMQEMNVCPDCDAHVIWYRSTIWKKLYGKPVSYLKAIQGVDLSGVTYEE